MAIETNEMIDVQTLSPFKRFIMTIGALPSSYLESMTYGEMLMWFCNYLQETVIPTVNNNAEAVEELQNLYEELKQYVDEYFDNLDVQEEVNKKIDEMAEDGTLTGIIKEYVDPIEEQFENQVNLTLTEQNANIQTIEDKVDAVTNGSPLPAESLDDMTNTDKIYVLISTGDWYYYDGDSWEIGGSYQSPVADYDTTLTVSNGVADSKSIGNRINQNYVKYNLIDSNNITNNKVYNNDGTMSDNSSYVLFNDIIKIKNGDKIYAVRTDTGHYVNKSLNYIIKVDAYGNFIERIGTVSTSYYTFTEDCYIQLNISKESYDYEGFIVYKNYPEYKYLTNSSYTDKDNELIKNINKTIDDNFVMYNYLDKNNVILNNNMDANGSVVYSNNTFFISNMIPVKNGDVVRFYNFNESNYRASQVSKYDTNQRFTARSSVTDNTFTADFNGYVIFNLIKPSASTDIGECDITINREISHHYAYGYHLKEYDELNKITVTKNSNTNFTITFDKFNVTLFKTVSSSSNSNNWNLKDIKKGSNVIVPEGTDFIGPVRINNNTDFIGGVHGDETTNHIYIIANGTTYKDSDIENIDYFGTNYLTIILISDIYDQIDGDLAFERYVIINIYDNKIHISNSYKAKKDLILKTACIGGLIACRNPIITSIVMNNSYFDEAPTSSPNNQSNLNTYGIINTTYGSVEINNIKGHENPNYIGYLVTYSNESPIRNKIYFNPYHNGNYNINTGTILSGEFEYTFN